MSDTAIIVLAAGNSSRLGRPKQLLSYRGRSLVSNVVCEARDAGLQPIIVVTGAYTQEVSNELAGYDVELSHNEKWQKGMGLGISKGMSRLLEISPDAGSVIIAVCDQPFVSSALFQQMAEKKQVTGGGIVACAYGDTYGTPVLFSAQYFDALLDLNGDGGAKVLLKRYHFDVADVPFPEGGIDIDTEKDYNALSGNYK